MTEVGNRPWICVSPRLPIIHGEKTVIRILDKGSTQFELAKLGFSERARRFSSEALEQAQRHHPGHRARPAAGNPRRFIPALTILNSPDTQYCHAGRPGRNISSPRINQVQVNTKVGLTFAKGLRSILRQDPDVIMVGEIRDLETAEIAIQAALTGHLVLSTLHTNDAPSAITRLRYMRVEPFLISASRPADHRAAPGSRALPGLQRTVRAARRPSCEKLVKAAADFHAGAQTYSSRKAATTATRPASKAAKGSTKFST